MSGVDEFAKWLGYAVMFACGTAAVSGLVIGAVMLFNRATWAVLGAWGGVKVFKQYLAWYHDQPENQKRA